MRNRQEEQPYLITFCPVLICPNSLNRLKLNTKLLTNKLRLILEQFMHTTDTTLTRKLDVHDVLVYGVVLSCWLLDYVRTHFGKVDDMVCRDFKQLPA